MRFIGNVEKDAQVRAIASGALPSGDTVVVNSDGTVSAVFQTAEVIGSPNVFQSAVTIKISATFDSASNKVVIAYRNGGNSNFGTAIVGTVGVSSISFGTPVVFESAAVDHVSITFDSNSNKVVVAYQDNGNSGRGTVAVGTVSGTSISFGTPVLFDADVATDISTTFDSSTNTVIIAYRDNGNSGRGTSLVGTVSGTSISFATPVVFQAVNTSEISATFDSTANRVVIASRDLASQTRTAVVGRPQSGNLIFDNAPVVFGSTASVGFQGRASATFDSNSSKIVIAYREGSVENTFFGTAIVGTVAVNAISFGTPVVFESANSKEISATFDANSNTVAIAYRDEGNSFVGTRISGAVSVTSISFDPATVFEAGTTDNISTVFDSVSNKVVIAYRDESNSDRGTATFFKSSVTNLTAENYIGFAAHTYADTQSALVNSTCTVDRNQTGLTAGQTYYVQTDGTLGTTAGDPSVVAGTAISSTSIIVKG